MMINISKCYIKTLIMVNHRLEIFSLPPPTAVAKYIAKQQRPRRTTPATTSFILAGAQRGGARHSGAPMLRRYAMTSALLKLMATLSAVLPSLQGR
jgi:hypothetical protein